jgi:hypothetical protein
MQLKRILVCLVLVLFIYPPGSIARTPIRSWSEDAVVFEDFCTREYSITFRFGQQDLSFYPTSVGYMTSLPGCQDYYYPGAPRVPYLPVTVPLDPTEKIAYVRSGSLQMELLDQKSSTLAKYKPLISTDGEAAQASLVQIPALFPPTSFSVISGNMGSGRIGSIKFFPLRVLDDQLYLTRQYTLVVGIVSHSVPLARVAPPPSYTKKISLIISPDELLAQAEELKLQHRINGYDAEVIPLSTIQQYPMADPLELSRISCFLDVSEGMRKRFASYDSDTARKIRAFLIDRLSTKSVDYVTILGDATYVPPSDYVFSTYNQDTYDRAIPTDFFYMAPSCDGVDYNLECSVGRIPVRSVQEAERYIQKMKRYQKTKQKSLLGSVALFGGDLFEDDYYGELQIGHMIDQGDFLGQKVTKKYQSEGLYTRDSILESLRTESNGFVFMSSHGRGDYLRLPKEYVDSIDILKLPPQNMLPIFVSDSCLNGSWDTRLSSIRYGSDGYLPYPTSFSQALLLSEGGAIAYVGGARINYAGMDYGFRDGVVESSRLYNTDALLHYVVSSYGQKDTTLGEIAVLGLRQYISSDMDYPGDWLLKALFGFCLLGDPTLPLPAKKSGSPATIDITQLPAIEDTNSGEIPELSMDQENKIILDSSADKLRVLISDYESWDAPVLYDALLLPDQSGKFSLTLPKLPKTRLAVRICAPSGEEKRFVFWSRFREDLRIVPPACFLRMPCGSNQTIPFHVVNDGLTDAINVSVQVIDGDSLIFEKKLPRLIPGQDYPLSFPFLFSLPDRTDPKKSGKSFHFSVNQLPEETFFADNHAMTTFYPTDQPIQRIGILEDDYGKDGSQLRDKLWLDRINEQYLAQNQGYEVNFISSSDIGSLSDLSLSLLVLYNTPYFNNEAEVLGEVEDLVKQGAKVLVIGPTSKKIRSLLGLKTTELFTVHQGDSSFQEFKPMKSTREYFSKESYLLPIFESVSPESKSLMSVLKEDTYLLGATSDELLYLSVHDSWYFFSGYLSKLDFERKIEAFTFFVDLLEMTLLRN